MAALESGLETNPPENCVCVCVCMCSPQNNNNKMMHVLKSSLILNYISPNKTTITATALVLLQFQLSVHFTTVVFFAVSYNVQSLTLS